MLTVMSLVNMPNKYPIIIDTADYAYLDFKYESYCRSHIEICRFKVTLEKLN